MEIKLTNILSNIQYEISKMKLNGDEPKTIYLSHKLYDRLITFGKSLPDHYPEMPISFLGIPVEKRCCNGRDFLIK